MSLPAEGFVLEYAPGRVLVGEGPLTPSAERPERGLACYAPDFFLDAATPWLVPAAWRELSRDDLRHSLPADRPPDPVCWDDVRADVYAEAFARFTRLIAAGHLTKAVPVVLERGRLHGDPRAFAPALLARVLDAPDPSLAYAVWSDAAGMVGASPEVLFRRDARSVETVAMAGTYPLDRAERLVDDAKETREHQSVVDDLIEALGPLGTVTLGAREVVRLPFMAHLKTDIALRPFADPSFADLVRALHPTAALGVAPRSAGLTPLRDLETAPGRGRFGAPFGVEWPDRRAVVLVAIRNVQWSGDAVTLGAGAGLLAESRLDREWEELRLKRAAVKAMLGL